MDVSARLARRNQRFDSVGNMSRCSMLFQTKAVTAVPHALLLTLTL